MRCHHCGKQITGEFTKALGQTWHKSCFLCCGCRKPIEGSFIKKEDQGWHPACFRKAFVPDCAVCGVPLTGSCLRDYWGNCFCLSHKNYAACTSCGRVVCGPLTGGGMRFSDGLTLCHLCTATGVTDRQHAARLAQEMRAELKTMGLDLFQAETPVRLVDRDALHSNSRHSFHSEHPLLGLAVWSTSSVGRRVVSRQFQEILIQSHLPEDHFRTVILHELGHAFVFYKQPPGPQDSPAGRRGPVCASGISVAEKTGHRRCPLPYHPDRRLHRSCLWTGFQKARQALGRLPLRFWCAISWKKDPCHRRCPPFFITDSAAVVPPSRLWCRHSAGAGWRVTGVSTCPAADGIPCRHVSLLSQGTGRQTGQRPRETAPATADDHKKQQGFGALGQPFQIME